MFNSEVSDLSPIDSAAVKSDNGVIYALPRPARHCRILQYMERLGIATINSTQGFLTLSGNFVDRATAHNRAVACKQIKPKSTLELFTEDLW